MLLLDILLMTGYNLQLYCAFTDTIDNKHCKVTEQEDGWLAN